MLGYCTHQPTAGGPVHVSAGGVPSSFATSIGDQPLLTSSSFQVYLARCWSPCLRRRRTPSHHLRSVSVAGWSLRRPVVAAAGVQLLRRRTSDALWFSGSVYWICMGPGTRPFCHQFMEQMCILRCAAGHRRGVYHLLRSWSKRSPGASPEVANAARPQRVRVQRLTSSPRTRRLT